MIDVWHGPKNETNYKEGSHEFEWLWRIEYRNTSCEGITTGLFNFIGDVNSGHSADYHTYLFYSTKWSKLWTKCKTKLHSTMP